MLSLFLRQYHNCYTQVTRCWSVFFRRNRIHRLLYKVQTIAVFLFKKTDLLTVLQPEGNKILNDGFTILNNPHYI